MYVLREELEVDFGWLFCLFSSEEGEDYDDKDKSWD